MLYPIELGVLVSGYFTQIVLPHKARSRVKGALGSQAAGLDRFFVVARVGVAL